MEDCDEAFWSYEFVVSWSLEFLMHFFLVPEFLDLPISLICVWLSIGSKEIEVDCRGIRKTEGLMKCSSRKTWVFGDSENYQYMAWDSIQ
jgi:hypothetical protein